MKTTVRIILYTSQSNRTKTKGCPICLCVTKHRQRKYIHLRLHAQPSKWSDEACRYVKDRRVNPNYVKDNAFLTEQESKANKIIGDFEREGKDWSLNQFEDVFLNKAKHGKIQDYFEQHIANLRDTGHIGNAICYERTFHILQLFDNKFRQRLFSEIDIRYIRALDLFLQKRHCAGNTRKFYMKTLRSLINKAIQDGEASYNTYPFGKRGFQIASLSEETAKRYLPGNYLEKIKITASAVPANEFARRLFLFSYYCGGISFVDMARLKKANVVRLEKGDYIVYKRQKTAHAKNVRSLQIAIRPEIQELLDWFGEKTPVVEDYLLPIVTIPGYKDAKLYTHIRNRRIKYGTYLKQLAEEMGFAGFNLTGYVSRHTMAMTLQNKGVAREKISQIMGHSDLETTNTYLDSFENEVIDEAMSLL